VHKFDNFCCQVSSTGVNVRKVAQTYKTGLKSVGSKSRPYLYVALVTKDEVLKILALGVYFFRRRF
jgi:hypothetical protein